MNYSYDNKFFSIYMSKYQKLTEEEKHELCRKAQAGDKEAFDTIILANLKLIVSKANKYAFLSSYEDIMQDCIEAMIKALKTFDPDQNGAFSAYMLQAIEFYIKQIIRQQSTIRMPSHRCIQIAKLQHFMQEYPELSIPELYPLMHEKGHVDNIEQFTRIVNAMNLVVLDSLDRPADVHNLNSDVTVCDLILSEEMSIENICSNKDIEERVYKIYSAFCSSHSPVHKTILDMRLSGMEFPEIAKKLGKSKQYIHTTYQNDIRTIRQMLQMEEISINDYVLD